MKRKKTETADSVKPRRKFLAALWMGLGLVALAEVCWMVFSFLRPRKPKAHRGSSNAVIEAGNVDRFVKETVTAFPRGRFYLSRLKDGGFLAISRTCTHLGCTVPWVEKEKNFICPCHASAFDITGSVINVPAPRALDLYQVIIENNIVKVDTTKRLKRSEFQNKQVVYPDEMTG